MLDKKFDMVVNSLTSLDSCSSLQILLDLCRVFIVESGCLLVEAHVAVVDIVHILLLVESSSATVFGAFFNPTKDKRMT